MILAAVGPGAAAEGREWATAHLSPARVRSPEPHVVIGASDTGGPTAPATPPSVAVRGSVVVVADAALYHRADLRRRLHAAGAAVPECGTPSELILAAYRAFGDRLAEGLEGEFAFVLWDGDRRRLVCGRDFLGRRPLHHARTGDTLIVASTARAVAAHPRCPRDLDLAAIAAIAAGLPEREWSTAWRAVRAHPTGRTLVASLARADEVDGVRVERHWSPPTFESGGGPPFEQAAGELREAIIAATVERLDEGRPTAVWLSGGWDSPTVYGAALEGMRRGPGGGVRAVTMSYPPGDPGREDELVEVIVAHRGERVAAWRDADDIPLFGDAAGRAALRDHPLAHPYGEWSRALAAATAATGARVALDGGGGDQLFQVSPIYMADLVARLRLASARREWRARGMTGTGWRRLVQYAVHPLLPAPMLLLARLARGGRPLPGARAWPVPPWIRSDFARAHDLARLGRPAVDRRPGERHSALESRWYFESAYPPAILLAQAEVAAADGVELRSPLLDRRVIELAARRPREERSDRGETKRLLRAAARGLVPDEILAPREMRTGVTSGYFERALAFELPGLAPLVAEDSALVALGIVDGEAFARAARGVARGGGGSFGVAMFYTVQVELWLRAHLGRG